MLRYRLKTASRIWRVSKEGFGRQTPEPGSDLNSQVPRRQYLTRAALRAGHGWLSRSRRLVAISVSILRCVPVIVVGLPPIHAGHDQRLVYAILILHGDL